MTLSISPVAQTAPAQAASLAAALQPGSVVSAQVLKLLDANLVRIAIASLTLDAVTTLPLQAGQTLQLAVTQTRDGVRLVPVEAETTSRGQAVLFDDSPLASKLPGQTEAVRAALSPAETKAVAVAAQAAVTKQASLSPLFANLTAAVTSGALPQPVLMAAAQVLGLRQPSDRVFTGADIKAALRSSGLVSEARLTAQTSSPVAALPDMKAALTLLRQVLASWTGEAAMKPDATMRNAIPSPQSSAQQAPAQQAASPDKTAPDIAGRAVTVAIISDLEPGDAAAASKPPAMATAAQRSAPSDQPVQAARNLVPPPMRDALPSAQAVASTSIAPDAEPVALAQRLIADTDAALARQTLLQIASLPEQVAGPRNETIQPRWNFEIPFVTPQGTAMAQFAISRDGTPNEADPAQRVWRARFSLDFEPAGPVHALISFSNDTTSVKMWAERPATAAQLRANAVELGASLDRAALKAGDIVIADGAPVRANAASAGHFLNRAS